MAPKTIKRQAARHGQNATKTRISSLPVVVGTLSFLMFVYGGYLAQRLLDPAAFPIKKIAIEGEFRYLMPEHLERAVSQAIDAGFFRVDVAAVRERILTEPWVYDAAVQRIWPDMLRVSITEQSAVARWGKYGLLNGKADIFVPDAGNTPDGLAVLDGPLGAEEEVLNRYLAMRRELGRVGLSVATLSLSARRAWQLEIEDGATLIIGRDAVAERLVRFTRAYETVLKPRWLRIARVDLRYTNGFAITESRDEINNG